jgi:hypothetical protein
VAIFAARNRHDPGEDPTDEQRSAVIASWKSTLIEKVRQLCAGTAQSESNQLEQSHANHQQRYKPGVTNVDSASVLTI